MIRTKPVPTMKRQKGKKPFKRRITVSSAKAKARWLQDWVAERIALLTETKWGHDDDALVQPRQMGQKGVDVALRGRASSLFPYAVECASGESWSVPKKVKQARKNLKLPYDHWLLFLKSKEMKSPIVVMEATHFFYLMNYLIYGKDYKKKGWKK